MALKEVKAAIAELDTIPAGHRPLQAQLLLSRLYLQTGRADTPQDCPRHSATSSPVQPRASQGLEIAHLLVTALPWIRNPRSRARPRFERAAIAGYLECLKACPHALEARDLVASLAQCRLPPPTLTACHILAGSLLPPALPSRR